LAINAASKPALWQVPARRFDSGGSGRSSNPRLACFMLWRARLGHLDSRDFFMGISLESPGPCARGFLYSLWIAVLGQRRS